MRRLAKIRPFANATVCQCGQGLDTSCDEFASVNDCIRGRLAGCEFAYYLSDVTGRFDQGVLTLNGRVPTFLLKRSLETLFCDIETIEQVINDVQVVSATGLSSVQNIAVPPGRSPA